MTGMYPSKHGLIWNTEKLSYDNLTDFRQGQPLYSHYLSQVGYRGVVLKVLRYRIGIFKGKKAMMAAIYHRCLFDQKLFFLVLVLILGLPDSLAWLHL